MFEHKSHLEFSVAWPGPPQTSKMKSFGKIANGIVAKIFVLVVCGSPSYASVIHLSGDRLGNVPKNGNDNRTDKIADLC